MKSHIVDKLQLFLSKRPKLKEECEVVYLMVELRKLLEHDESESSKNSPLVRFHADWTLHISKNHITPEMKEIMERVDASLDIYPIDGNLDFLLLPEFRSELAQFLNSYGLPATICKSNENWVEFISVLTQVLADQPIVNPTDNIAEFRYVDMKNEGIMATIDFRGAKAGGSITLGMGF